VIHPRPGKKDSRVKLKDFISTSDKGSPAPGPVASMSKWTNVVKKVKYVEVSDEEDSAREPHKLEVVQGGVGKERKNHRQKGPLQVEQTKSGSGDEGHVPSQFKSKWPLRKAAPPIQHKGIIPPAGTALRHEILTCDLCWSCNLHRQSEIVDLSDEEVSKFELVVV
jgi:hypothetical protein